MMMDDDNHDDDDGEDGYNDNTKIDDYHNDNGD